MACHATLSTHSFHIEKRKNESTQRDGCCWSANAWAYRSVLTRNSPLPAHHPTIDRRNPRAILIVQKRSTATQVKARSVWDAPLGSINGPCSTTRTRARDLSQGLRREAFAEQQAQRRALGLPRGGCSSDNVRIFVPRPRIASLAVSIDRLVLFRMRLPARLQWRPWIHCRQFRRIACSIINTQDRLRGLTSRGRGRRPDSEYE